MDIDRLFEYLCEKEHPIVKRFFRLFMKIGIVVSIVAFLAFLVFAYIITREHPLKIAIVNQSGQNVPEIALTCRNGVFRFKNLENGKIWKTEFSLQGEDAYKLTVKLQSGKVLKSEAYIENGYKVQESIKNDKIEQHTTLLHFF